MEVLVFQDCSVLPDFRTNSTKVISRSVDHLQLFSFQIFPSQLIEFVSLFRDLHILEMDRCELDVGQLKQILLDQPILHTLKCSTWTHNSVQRSGIADLQVDFRHCRLQTNKQTFAAFEEDYLDRRTMAVKVLDEYANFAAILSHEANS